MPKEFNIPSPEEIEKFKSLLDNPFAGKAELEQLAQNEAFQIYSLGYLHGLIKGQDIVAKSNDDLEGRKHLLQAATKPLTTYMKIELPKQETREIPIDSSLTDEEFATLLRKREQRVYADLRINVLSALNIDENRVEKLANLEIRKLPVSVKTMNRLLHYDIEKLSDLYGLTWEDIMNIRQFGTKSAFELRDGLQELLGKPETIQETKTQNPIAPVKLFTEGDIDEVTKNTVLERFIRAIFPRNYKYGDAIDKEQDIEEVVSKILVKTLEFNRHKDPNRDIEIIKQYFGLDNGRAKTLKEVGLNFGVSQERIRQIKTHVLAVIRWILDRNLKV